MKRIYGKDPEPEPVHSYSSTQVNITGHPAELMRKLAMSIPDKDLHVEKAVSHGGASADDGREHEPHVTCRWGLHFQTPSTKLRNALKEFGPVTLTLGKVSLFENDDADVLKVDVDSPDLHRLYALIGRVVPTHTTFPNYQPHGTIAYLKPGKGKQYLGDKSLAGQKLTFKSVIFSGKKNHREELPLTSSVPAYRAR